VRLAAAIQRPRSAATAASAIAQSTMLSGYDIEKTNPIGNSAR
jgi:hypothetical protein